jgi:hypothetical protein
VFPGAPPVAAPAAPAAGAPREETFSYTFVNTPFWDVIERLCRDAHLVLQQGWGDDTVRLFHGGGYAPHTGRDGAFRYSAANLQMYRNVDLATINPRAPAAAPRSESLTLHVSLFAEPRLPFLGQTGEVRLEAAYDSERNSMIPRDAPGEINEGPFGARVSRRYYGAYNKQTSIQVQVNLNRVSEKATSIKLLKGVVPVTLLVEQKPVNITDNFLSSKGKKTLAGDVEFSIENVQKMANNQFQVKFTATNKSGVNNDYNWAHSMYQRLELLDAKGQKYQNWGTSWHGGAGNNQAIMSLTFSSFGNKIGPPTRFVYQHWVTRQHDIHFTFRDVPLP